MTRRDYVAIARAIAEEVPFYVGGAGMQVIKNVAERIADHCAATNPKFDRERFLRDCGVAS